MSGFTDKREVYPIINPEMLGHCFIINNVATEYPGSLKDVVALQTVYEQMKFRVTVYKNCDDRMMRLIRRRLSKEKTHQGMSMVAVHIITHGTREGILQSTSEFGQGFLLGDLVGTVCDVQVLRGKPKIFFVNACRGDALSRVEPKDQDKDVTLAQAFTIQIDPHEADVFIGYSTTPGKVSPINPRHGTHYFQVLSTYLQDYYKSKPLDLIYTLVTDVVTKRVHLIDEHDGMYVPQKVSTLRATLYLTATPQNKEELLKETVENLAQENHQLRTENDHLKGTRKSTIMKMFYFTVLFLFALFVITYSNIHKPSYFQNGTHGETLVINVALDGQPVHSTSLEGKTVASYGNINFNIQYDPNKIKETLDEENSESFGEEQNENEELNFGSSYLERLYAMKEDIIPRVRKYSNKITETDQRVDEILEDINEEVVLLKDTKVLAKNVENLVTEEYGIRQTFKDMYRNLKNISGLCRELKNLDRTFRVGHNIYFELRVRHKMYVELEQLLIKVSSCIQLTTVAYIKQSHSDAIEKLQKCDYVINMQRFYNFVMEITKVHEQTISQVEESTRVVNILNATNPDESARSGIMRARLSILKGIMEKFSNIIPNIEESLNLNEKAVSMGEKAFKCLRPALIKDMNMNPAQWIIEDVKQIFEAYAAISKVKETI